jgi:DNA-binding response OmpR family regulator
MELKYNSILFVHIADDKFVSTFMSHFEEKGMNVIHVDNFNDAYGIMGSKQIDLVVMDMDTSYAEGFKFAYKVKKNKNLKNVFIIALSAAHQKYGIYLEDRTREARKWMNVDMWVNKPISAKNLYLLIKKEIALLEGIDTKQLDSEPEYHIL